jgi:molecular chaperone GrpE
MEQENLENTEEIEIINWEDRYLRLLADFENYKKRSNKEKILLSEDIKFKTILPILDLYDDLNISIGMITTIEGRESIGIFIDKFKTIIGSMGLEEIQTETYDSNLHEVASIVPLSIVQFGEENQILDIIQRGWKIGERILRYPKVVICK